MNIPASFDYPDRLPDEPPASTGQLRRLRELLPQQPSDTLNKLGRHQATCLIYSVENGQRIMQQTIDACANLIRDENHNPATDADSAKASNTGRVTLAAAIGALLGISVS